jgi:drug/metabolite transporter (DMT)-like permease
LFGKPLADRYAPLTILTYGFGFGVLVLLPFQPFTPQPWPIPAASGRWFALLITLATVAPFTAYTFGLSRLPASVAGILTVAEIPFATLFAFLALGERFAAAQWLGAILVVSGVLLLSWGQWRQPKARAGSGGGEEPCAEGLDA